MECFLILWLLDDRWALGYCPFVIELIFLLPTSLNIVFFALLISFKVKTICNSPYTYLDIIILSGILILLHVVYIVRLIIIRMQYIKHSLMIPENSSKASTYIYRLNQKRISWSILSLLTFLVSLMLFGFNRKYLDTMECGNIIVQIHFYFNSVFIAYVGLVFIVFWIAKIAYLLIAWKFPKYYL